MKITTEVVKPTPNPRKYPYLGEFRDGEVVLFTAEATGTTIKHSEYSRIGYSSTTWCEHTATPLPPGTTITIKVEE